MIKNKRNGKKITAKTAAKVLIHDRIISMDPDLTEAFGGKLTDREREDIKRHVKNLRDRILTMFSWDQIMKELSEEPEC